ncbi:hypothetical protein VNO77_27268 [Canavalia gladiata]|uniref:Uncharacterized protein n=1 Tax=Canavalia gladiata TaxID=3824 RepID=A0AAN9Q6B2_CANGL
MSYTICNFNLLSSSSQTSASLKFTSVKPKGLNLDNGDLGYVPKLGNYAEHSGAPKEDEVYGPEATMTGICKEAIQCITVAA